MNVHLTTPQLRVLDQLNAQEDDAWGITEAGLTQDIDGERVELLEVTIDAYSLNNYVRFIAPDGRVYRYDDNSDEFVRSFLTPLQGTLKLRIADGTTRNRSYRY